MRKILTLVLACVAVVAVPASASASSPYVVSAVASTTTPEANHSFSITGSVSPNAHGKTVTLYRRYAGASSYTKVSTKKLTSSSRYAFSVKTSHPGKITYKITKPSSSSRAGGSKAVAITVYRWRNVTDLVGTPAGVAAETSSSTIKGWPFPHSVETGINGQITYALGSVCTKFKATIGFNVGPSSPGINGAAYVRLTDSALPFQQIAGSTVYKDGFGFFVTDATKIIGMDTLILRSEVGDVADSTDRVVFGTPQVYCAS